MIALALSPDLLAGFWHPLGYFSSVVCGAFWRVFIGAVIGGPRMGWREMDGGEEEGMGGERWKAYGREGLMEDKWWWFNHNYT